MNEYFEDCIAGPKSKRADWNFIDERAMKAFMLNRDTSEFTDVKKIYNNQKTHNIYFGSEYKKYIQYLIGDKTSAKIDMMNYSSDVSFRIIYSNNVSNNGNDRRLYVKYNGKEITLKVLEGNDTNKVIIEENSEMTGSIVDNNCKFAEVMCKAMISANIKKI